MERWTQEPFRKTTWRWMGIATALAATAILGFAEPAFGSRPLGGTHREPPRGVVVAGVQAGLAAERAGLAPGDRLLSWRRAASPPRHPEPASGALHSPFDLRWIEIEQAPRGAVELVGLRDGDALAVRLPPGKWGIEARPHLAGVELAGYREGEELLVGGKIKAGAERWRRLASELAAAGDSDVAGWLHAELGHRLASVQEPERSEDAFGASIRELTAAGHRREMALVHDARGGLRARRNDYDSAEDDYRAALELRRELGGDELSVAHSFNLLGQVAVWRGDLDTAVERFDRCRELREELAPGSLELAGILNNLGLILQRQGELDRAEKVLRRALGIGEKLDPTGIQFASSLNNLGLVAIRRGDLAAAQEAFQRALEIGGDLEPELRAWALNNLGYLLRDRGDLPEAENHLRRALELWQEIAADSPRTAATLNNLGLVAVDRKDHAAAEGYFRRAYRIWERLAPESLDATLSLNNLGNVALERGDLERAAEWHRRALELRRRLAPESLDVAESLNNLGRVLIEEGRPEAAEDAYRRALEIKTKLAPDSLTLAYTRHQLGRAAAERGDLAAAEDHHRRALGIRERLAPGTTAEAESCHHLALLQERRGRPDEALELHRRAVAALDAQRQRLGGSDEVRAGFADRYADFYRRYLELLIERDRPAEAFHVLERYRARTFLALLAERDLLFDADVPPALDRERRIVKTRHDRLVRELFEVADPERRNRLRDELEEVRRRGEEVTARIRAASPRLAELESPRPLDLDATRRTLDPGTLLLSYSVGSETTHLFVLGAGVELAVHRLPVGADELRHQVENFRATLEAGRFDSRTARLRLQARGLGERLLAPAAERIAGANRLLILPDGPLHFLPFAALVPPGDGDPGYLSAGRPIHVAASATVFDQLKRERRPRPAAAPRLRAFADPVYPQATTAEPAAGASADPVRALLGERELPPLPATREEVARLAELFPGTSRVYLGSRATEGKAKEVAPEAELLHFACHGFLDPRSPLDSGLALTLPARWRRGEENGLLQAWEIFEELRLDADLVTLSACDTGLGKLYAGEGLLGLSRAFHYAGARSVLASLWSVSDRSTGELMRRFYGHLVAGESKDEALRRAQMELSRNPRFAHPFHWAGFELIGDWR